MPRIRLIVTGDMEELALHKSLQQCFPSTRNNKNVIWDTPRKLDCATSHRLRQDALPSGPMKNLAQAMLDDAIPGKNGKPADLVIVIDDVELGNLGQEHIIAKHFRMAVQNHLGKVKYSSNIEEIKERLREKCSFHLLKPMVESYLFGDANALRVAGVPQTKTPMLVHPTDVETFETNDPSWLRICQDENAKRRELTPWWRHECHPKHYLEDYLIEGNYEESQNGKDALEKLDWQQVPKCQTDILFIRSLFEDISTWFDIPNPIGTGETSPDFYPSKSVRRANLLLRNM